MKKQKLKKLWWSLGLLVCFALWSYLVCIVDVQAIGPRGSSVGFSQINAWFHKYTGVNMWLYTVTDWLGLLPVAIGFGFAVFGLCQWIKRKNILKVDFDILMLGAFYIITLFAYLFFEEVIINCRPVIINGHLEASYPSSTTLLVLCVMSTAIIQFNSRIKHKNLRILTDILTIILIIFMVVGRLISGVHWLSDIIGSIMLSLGIVMMYDYIISTHEIDA